VSVFILSHGCMGMVRPSTSLRMRRTERAINGVDAGAILHPSSS